MTNAPDTKNLAWPLLKRVGVEIGPVVVLFVGFMWKGLTVATVGFMAAAVLSVLASLKSYRRLPTIPLISAAIVLALGTLTLVVDRAAFIKMQPTVANGFFAAAIGLGTLAGRNLLRRSFSPPLQLTETGWRRLSWAACGYLGALTVLNEVVWRSTTTETWVYFKTFVILPSNVVFGLALIPLIRAHWAGRDGGVSGEAAEGAVRREA